MQRIGVNNVRSLNNWHTEPEEWCKECKESTFWNSHHHFKVKVIIIEL